ncbi:pilus assembly protein [Variovorax sp. OV329]|uniref:pilus assembly protein n=1 Tax=Variovorax sp. OV329 TaxID=1882825 RepID=UPI0008E4BA1E|nr:PilC/PilY family type IV pilus protein [Variovorax sp. OV329]SFM31806.1 type IV pilus assembly protein PilY1 [Variovorax sp. OV329]
MQQESTARRKALQRAIVLIASGAMLLQPLRAHAASTDLADVPLLVQTGVKPNVLFTLDNSGSMGWGSITGSDAHGEYTSPYDDAVRAGQSPGMRSTTGAKNRRAYYSPSYNRQYYNPAITYLAPVEFDGGAPGFLSAMGDSLPAAARIDAYLDARLLDLTEACWSSSTPPALPRFNAGDFTQNGSCANAPDVVRNTEYQRYSFFYRWRGVGTEDGSAAQDSDSNYDRVEIRSSTSTYPKAATRTDCGNASATSCSFAQESQNFANWFSYYRTRMQSAKTALGLAFSALDAKSRVGFSTINNNAGQDNDSGANFVPLADFDSAQKQRWYDQLYGIRPTGGTPLVPALDRAGRYYTSGSMPGAAGAASRSDTVPLSCTPNYTILSTDGYWTSRGSVSVGDTDRTVPDLPANVYADPATGAARNDPIAGVPLVAGQDFPAPFFDGTGTSDSLADVAMRYWIRDMTGNSAGKVQATPGDPATWQHMVTYSIGLGATGTLSAPPAAGSTWPVPQPGTATAIDDLWHAALNGHGQYFNSSDPERLRTSLGSILDDIVNRTGSASAVSVSNPSLLPGNNLAFAASFNSGAWFGDLEAFPVDLQTGVLSATPLWSAQARLDAKPSANRYVASFNGTAGVPFTATGLGAGKAARLNSPGVPPGPSDNAAVIAYLRGDRSGEAVAGSTSRPYRGRAHVLGDVVDAEPVYVTAPRANYTDPGYGDFKTGPAASRAKVVYQGANDGMLHAFDAASGEELWAYVPGALVDAPLSSARPGTSALVGLTQQGLFQHRFYVDGTPTATDVDLSNTALNQPAPPSPRWATLLVGGLAKGGRGYYALNVTDPAAGNDAEVAAKLLWEFPNAGTSATTRNNIGFSYGVPLNVKTRAAGWVTLVSSGYNNGDGTGGDGQGHLFVLDTANGQVVRDLQTSAGTPTTPSGLARMSAFLVNPGSDDTVDFVYGGDLLGNVWRFDLSGATTGSWNVTLLATLVDKSGVPQPVTAAPELGVVNGKRVVYVGTGRYLGPSDVPGAPGASASATQQQSFYGLMDDMSGAPIAAPLRGQLVAQSATPAPNGEINITTNPVNFATKRGWVLDFAPSPSGERSATSPVLFGGVLSFTTNTPSADPCKPGGSSNLYFLNYSNGGAIPMLASRYVGDVLASRVQPIGLPGGGTKILVRTSEGGTRTFGVQVPASTAPTRVMWREVARD